MNTPFVPPRYQLIKKDAKKLHKIATELFSLYIRRKTADAAGMVGCFTCHRRLHYTEMHCGHFAPRANMCTKFLEINNHPQCPVCNITYSGNPSNYRRQIDRTYGKGMADHIESLSRKTCKWTKADYIELIVTVEREIEQL
jgi:hypothetical protein